MKVEELRRNIYANPDVMYKIIARLSMTFTANGKNETFAVSL